MKKVTVIKISQAFWKRHCVWLQKFIIQDVNDPQPVTVRVNTKGWEAPV